ncbi:MAG: tetratricopeptide repeat protein [Chitinophagaceae bacterium]|nr:tetratricopeptide repeat protein [Chitinophagaceae bacterium]
MKRIAVFMVLLLLCGRIAAQKAYEFNSICQQAYQEITKLRIEPGLALVEKARQQNPDNLIPILLESYADFYILFLNEDPAEYQARYPKFLERIDRLSEGPKSSPFYYYCLSMVRMQRAAVSIKFGKFWDAGWDCRRAYNLIKDNRKQFPTFSPNDLTYGALQAITGTIPKGYKWLAAIFGMRGSQTEGMRIVKGFINSNDPWSKLFFNEAAFMYPYLLFYLENKKDEALAFTQQRRLDLVNNHLHAYMAANLGINKQQSEFAKNIILNRNRSGEYLKTSVWDLELGYTRIYHLETQEAARSLEYFLANFKGKFYVKDALQKLSWCYYLQGNLPKAEEIRKRILVKGATDSEADKQALRDAKTGRWPNILLLKARLLNDGGYHSDAAALLQGKTENDFSTEEDKLEFVYRMGRIDDDMGRDEEAIRNYQNAIRKGEHRTEYYAARAALQIGQIYEKKGQKALAIQYYQRCIDMDDHEFKNSLDQRAKSGIARCKGE